MADSIRLEITTPEKQEFQGEAFEVIVPGANGLMGIRPGHAPVLAAMSEGILQIQTEEESLFFAIGGGFVEVSGDRMRILADTAERAEDIDEDRAREALESSERAMKGLTAGTSEYIHQEKRHKRAALRLLLAKNSESSRG